MNPVSDARPDDDPDALVRLAGMLEHDCPVPSAAFRADLRRQLLAQDAALPPRLRLLIAGYASAGLALLLIGAASTASLGGPLAA